MRDRPAIGPEDDAHAPPHAVHEEESPVGRGVYDWGEKYNRSASQRAGLDRSRHRNRRGYTSRRGFGYVTTAVHPPGMHKATRAGLRNKGQTAPVGDGIVSSSLSEIIAQR